LLLWVVRSRQAEGQVWPPSPFLIPFLEAG
jgi:hypothetical protein